MTSEPTALPGVLILKPDIFPDERGVFLESYNQGALKMAGINDVFIQDNLSVNKKGVLRGLHLQKEPFAQGKLVSVVSGSAFDVAVDINPQSPTFKKWVGVILS